MKKTEREKIFLIFVVAIACVVPIYAVPALMLYLVVGDSSLIAITFSIVFNINVFNFTKKGKR